MKNNQLIKDLLEVLEKHNLIVDSLNITQEDLAKSNGGMNITLSTREVRNDQQTDETSREYYRVKKHRYCYTSPSNPTVRVLEDKKTIVAAIPPYEFWQLSGGRYVFHIPMNVKEKSIFIPRVIDNYKLYDVDGYIHYLFSLDCKNGYIEVSLSDHFDPNSVTLPAEIIFKLCEKTTGKVLNALAYVNA